MGAPERGGWACTRRRAGAASKAVASWPPAAFALAGAQEGEACALAAAGACVSHWGTTPSARCRGREQRGGPSYAARAASLSAAAARDAARPCAEVPDAASLCQGRGGSYYAARRAPSSSPEVEITVRPCSKAEDAASAATHAAAQVADAARRAAQEAAAPGAGLSLFGSARPARRLE